MPEDGRTRVLIADDHEAYRLGLRLIVESIPGYTVCAEATDGGQVLRLTRKHHPHLIILDYSMPGKSGLDVLYDLKRYKIDTHILMLTAVESEGILGEVLSAGADGLCLKQESNDALRAAIMDVSDGRQYVSSAALPLTERAGAITRLTPRERQVLMQIVQGRRNREIAESMNVSVKTVDVHRTNLMKKLDLHSVAELVDFANKSGLTAG